MKKSIASVAVLFTALLVLAGCGQSHNSASSNPAPQPQYQQQAAPQPAAPQYAQQPQQPQTAPVVDAQQQAQYDAQQQQALAAEQTSYAPSIPVCNDPYPLYQVLAGVHGVDWYGRPVNACGYPVNVYGELADGPSTTRASEIFASQPRYEYRLYLGQNYGFYHPIWGVGFFHLYGGYGGTTVIVHRTYVTTMTYRQPVTSVSTHVVLPGHSRDVTPGAKTVAPSVTPAPLAGTQPKASNGTIGGGTVTNTVKPADPAVQSKFVRPAAAAPAAVAPAPAAVPPASKFVRPAAAAPAPSRLNLVKPSTSSSSSSSSPSKFNRPKH